MKQKDDRTIEERAQDLQKVLTWCIIHNIKKHYNTLDNFKKTYFLIKHGKTTNQTQVDFCRRFGFDSNVVIRKILGRKDTEWVKLSDVKTLLPKWLHYRRSNTKHFKSGKHYVVHSYWYIDFDVIERYIDDADIADCRSSFYTKEQHHLINKIFLKDKGTNKMRKINGYTKEQWDEKYANGELAMTWEQAVKSEQKNKRAADKRKMTIAKNAAKQTLAEYAKL